MTRTGFQDLADFSRGEIDALVDTARRAYRQRCASGPQPDKWFLVTVKQIHP